MNPPTADAAPASNWPCGLVTAQADGLIVDVNETFLRWTGFHAADLVGVRRLRDLLSIGGRIYFETHIGPLLSMQHEVSEVAVDFMGANGESFPALLNAAVDNGGARFAVFPATQRRSYERELLDARRAAEQAGAVSERVQRRLSFMADVNLVLSGTLSLSTALERLATMLAADRRGYCVILTVSEEHETDPFVLAAATHDDAVLNERARSLGDRLVATAGIAGVGGVLAHPTAQLLSNVLVQGCDPEFGSVAVVPVRSRDQQVATLLLARDSAEEPFASSDVLELARLAEPIGVFIDNLRLYAREHNRAVALQEALLTPAVHVPDLEIVTRYLPGADGAMVGGDWYDSLIRPDGSTVLAIGDVIGHDHRAAAAMGQLRGLLRAIAYTADVRPSEILAKTDQAARGLGVGALATAVVVEFGAARQFVWATAGHPPPALITADGAVRLLDDQPDLLLGVNPRRQRRDRDESWQPGDTLVLYTDGLIENQFRSIDTGLGILTSTLRMLGRAPLAELCDRLIAQMSGGHRSDDIAVLAVRAR